MPPFQIVTDFTPQGDQPQAIEKLSEGVMRGEKHQVLLGVTGSGKTFSMAHVVERVQKPTLVIAPNKTLAAQLYGEFKELFPNNAVEYFVSYYDYYQPEAYLPTTDTYIAKDASINDTIDKMRHSATHSLFERRDVIIVASVSCIYGLGSPEEYKNMLVLFQNQAEVSRDEILSRLVEIQYERNDYDFARGTFRVRGDVIEIFPAYEEERAIRIEFFGDTIDAITEIDPLRGKVLRKLNKIPIYPNSHYVTGKERLKSLTLLETGRQGGRSARASLEKVAGASRGRQGAPATWKQGSKIGLQRPHLRFSLRMPILSFVWHVSIPIWLTRRSSA